VLGLGDSNLLLDRQTTTAKDCNQVAQQLDARLEALSGQRRYSLGVSDERTGLTEVEPWIDGLWASLK
jgi:NADPH-ferrihemoprotein reductase